MDANANGRAGGSLAPALVTRWPNAGHAGPGGGSITSCPSCARKRATGRYLTQEKNEGSVLALSWSPDGSRIYYDRQKSLPSGIYSIPVIGGSPRLLLENAGTPEALPDGSLLGGRFNSQSQMQLFRFWPDTGRIQDYPFEITWDNGQPIRVFQGGKSAAVIGTPIPMPAGTTGRHLYVIDLASGRCRPVFTDESLASATVTVTRDDETVLFAGYGTGIRSISVAGGKHARTLLPLPGRIFTIEASLGGSILADQIQRTPELTLLKGGRAERLMASPLSGPTFNFTVLPDGRAIWVQVVAGRQQLIAIRPGGTPEPVVSTSDPTTSPATQLKNGRTRFHCRCPASVRLGSPQWQRAGSFGVSLSTKARSRR